MHRLLGFYTQKKKIRHCYEGDAMSKVCHPERRAKPEVEGSSHQISSEQMASAKILRLALLAQDDKQVAAVRGNDVFFFRLHSLTKYVIIF